MKFYTETGITITGVTVIMVGYLAGYAIGWVIDNIFF